MEILILEGLLVAILIFIFYILKKVQKNQMRKIFIILLGILFWICLFLVLQYWGGLKLGIPAILFEYFIYIGNCFLPVTLFFTSLIFINTNIKLKKSHILLFIIPIVSLLVVWTNDLHHLFYVNYSTNLSETIFGPYSVIYQIYTYVLFIAAIFNLLKYSIKNAGFFSKQSILIVLGTLIPIIVNVFGSFGIINMSIYLTPISFTFAIFCYAIAMFKFKFLSVTPIAMQRIVDRMSDSFLVINEDGTITDFNDTFLRTFNLQTENVRNVKFIEFIKSQSLKDIDGELVNPILEKCKTTEETVLVNGEMQIKDKYFNVEASGIFSDNTFLGTLILLKDVTQHIEDMQTIKNNQNMLMERERLASLGQLIGGIAHNLKTPIMSISGAAEGLTDLVKEYQKSVGDPEVTKEDHYDIAKDMEEWIKKIKSYTEYMSDVITAVKGQAVTMSDEKAVSFTLDELVKRIDILMRHELKNALVTLNVEMKADASTVLQGNINSLVQVINNMISNSIQAYIGIPNSTINLILEQEENNIVISIQDFGIGLPEEVQAKLFKEMITTKGKNGTGLGMFMSYSTIRAHFNGNITFETEKGSGTTFHITIPI